MAFLPSSPPPSIPFHQPYEDLQVMKTPELQAHITHLLIYSNQAQGQMESLHYASEFPLNFYNMKQLKYSPRFKFVFSSGIFASEIKYSADPYSPNIYLTICFIFCLTSKHQHQLKVRLHKNKKVCFSWQQITVIIIKNNLRFYEATIGEAKL